MPVQTFDFREARRQEVVGDLCEALGNARNGWNSNKIRVAVGQTMTSLGCK